MTRLLLLQKVESNGSPIFKVLLVLKKVLWTFSYLYLWPTMWFHAEKLLKTLKIWKFAMNWLFNLSSRYQKSPKIPPKNLAFNRDFLNFFLVWHILDDTWRSLCPDGSEYIWQKGVESLQGRVTSYGRPKLTLISNEKKYVQLCLPKSFGHNFNARAKSSWEDILKAYKKSS